MIKKTKKKKTRVDWKNIMAGLAIIFLVSVMVTSAHYNSMAREWFYLGFHNRDAGHNMMKLNAMYNITLVDITSTYNTWTATQAYINGDNLQRKAFNLAVLSASVFGYCVAILIGMLGLNHGKQKKKGG